MWCLMIKMLKKMPWYKIIDIYSRSFVAWMKVSLNIYYIH